MKNTVVEYSTSDALFSSKSPPTPFSLMQFLGVSSLSFSKELCFTAPESAHISMLTKLFQAQLFLYREYKELHHQYNIQIWIQFLQSYQNYIPVMSKSSFLSDFLQVTLAMVQHFMIILCTSFFHLRAVYLLTDISCTCQLIYFIYFTNKNNQEY